MGEFLMPDEDMGGIPASVADGPSGQIEVKAGLDYSQLKVGDTVYRNYSAQVPPVKGKVTSISQDRHGTGFIGVKWAEATGSFSEDDETLELASWLRKDVDHPIGHIEPDLFATTAGLSTVFDKKRAVLVGDGIKIVFSSMRNCYEIYIDGSLKATALTMDEVKDRLDEAEAYVYGPSDDEALAEESQKTQEPVLYGESVDHEMAKAVSSGMIEHSLPFDTAFEIASKDYPTCHYSAVKFLATLACVKQGYTPNGYEPVKKTGYKYGDEVVVKMEDGTESYGLVKGSNVGGVEVYLEDGSEITFDRTKIRPK